MLWHNYTNEWIFC